LSGGVLGGLWHCMLIYEHRRCPGSCGSAGWLSVNLSGGEAGLVRRLGELVGAAALWVGAWPALHPGTGALSPPSRPPAWPASGLQAHSRARACGGPDRERQEQAHFRATRPAANRPDGAASAASPHPLLLGLVGSVELVQPALVKAPHGQSTGLCKGSFDIHCCRPTSFRGFVKQTC
jgi:hypothetical protein